MPQKKTQFYKKWIFTAFLGLSFFGGTVFLEDPPPPLPDPCDTCAATDEKVLSQTNCQGEWEPWGSGERNKQLTRTVTLQDLFSGCGACPGYANGWSASYDEVWISDCSKFTQTDTKAPTCKYKFNKSGWSRGSVKAEPTDCEDEGTSPDGDFNGEVASGCDYTSKITESISVFRQIPTSVNISDYANNKKECTEIYTSEGTSLAETGALIDNLSPIPMNGYDQEAPLEISITPGTEGTSGAIEYLASNEKSIVSDNLQTVTANKHMQIAWNVRDQPEDGVSGTSGMTYDFASSGIGGIAPESLFTIFAIKEPRRQIQPFGS